MTATGTRASACVWSVVRQTRKQIGKQTEGRQVPGSRRPGTGRRRTAQADPRGQRPSIRRDFPAKPGEFVFEK